MAEELAPDMPALVGEDIVEPAVEAPKRKYDRSIVEGPLTRAVWKMAWPAVLTNLVSGLQGWVDQIMVGNLIGYQRHFRYFSWSLRS